MSFRCTLFIALFLSLLAGQGLAQTDSVYSRMMLGSAGYNTLFGAPAKYARSQTLILQRLKSTELAEIAVRKCFSDQQSKLPEATYNSHAKKCAAALKVNTSGDTAALAFGNPNISGIVPVVYLDNLMMVFLEDNMIYGRDANQKSLDSLDVLINDSRTVMLNSRDTLISFCNTSDFRSETHDLLYRLFDTVALFKKNLAEIGYNQQTIASMFYQLDTAMFRFTLGYKDTVSDYWDVKYAGVGVAVYDCEYILAGFRCYLNAALSMCTDTTMRPQLNEVQRGALFYTFEDILTGDKVRQFYYYSYEESRTPVKSKTFTSVSQRYQTNCETYHKLVNARGTTMVQRASIIPGSYILCIASKVKC